MYCCGDSYVIRIYRREENDPRQMIGQVELVGLDEKKAFTTIEELWGILGDAGRKKQKKRNPAPLSE